ncbi:MAG TPA: hypothetical protein EYN67_08195 [Flavobacteriales bacterium]|nr:hypothetical protein [Flavobacteriales bacterium]
MNIKDEILYDYQYVRLLDVFLLAPIMIYASTFKALPDWVRLVLLVSGVATMVFNGKNYLEIEKQKDNQ